jgi:hypothetical protein
MSHVHKKKDDEIKRGVLDIIEKVFNNPDNDYDKLLNLISKTGFNYDKEQRIFYSSLDAWQHNVGYFTLYDKAAPFSLMFIHCEPIRFEYDGRNWKIEFWKGQYGICTGAEIGIYTGKFQIDTEIPEINHTIERLNPGKDTQCAGIADWLQMSFTLFKNGVKLFTRDSDIPKTPGVERHWWLTGFKPGIISSPSDLIMDIAIVLKDEEMCKAFVKGLKAVNYEVSDFEIKDLTVKFKFDIPNTPQPW